MIKAEAIQIKLIKTKTLTVVWSTLKIVTLLFLFSIRSKVQYVFWSFLWRLVVFIFIELLKKRGFFLP